MKYTIRSVAIAAFLIIGAFIVGAAFAGGLMEEVQPEDLTDTQKGASVLTCTDNSAEGDGFVQLGGNNANC